MKSLTLSVDEKVLAAAQRYALASATSVDGLVQQFLAEIAEREVRVQAARQRIRALSDESAARLGEKSWTRDDLHAR